jgi:hypothetical protein
MLNEAVPPNGAVAGFAPKAEAPKAGWEEPKGVPAEVEPAAEGLLVPNGVVDPKGEEVEPREFDYCQTLPKVFFLKVINFQPSVAVGQSGAF